jgi:lipopolysaccharide export system permease protein
VRVLANVLQKASTVVTAPYRALFRSLSLAMFIIPRYILRAHIGPFLFGSCTVMFVFLLQFLMNYLNQFLGKGLETWLIVQLIALNLAWMVTLAVPMGVLVSTLMAFGNLSASNEVVIITSSGGGLLRMMSPVLTVGVMLSLGLFWFNDKVLPDANFRALALMTDIQRKKPTFAIEKGQFSTQIEGYSILAHRIDSATNTMLGVTIYDNTKFDRLNVVSADSGVINFSSNGNKLVLNLKHGEIHQLNQQNFGDYRKISFDTHRIIMEASGFDFKRTDENTYHRGDRTMCIADMRAIVRHNDSSIQVARSRAHTQTDRHLRYTQGRFDSALTAEIRTIQLQYTPQLSQPALTDSARRVQDSLRNRVITREEATWRIESKLTGLRATLDNDALHIRDRELESDKYLVEIHKKYVIPAACFIFALIGCPLGVITRRGNFGVSGAITLFFYVIYWAFLMVGERLADRGIMPPWLSMWLADIVLGVVGLVLMILVSNESVGLGLEKFWKAWYTLQDWFASLKARIDRQFKRRAQEQKEAEHVTHVESTAE